MPGIVQAAGDGSASNVIRCSDALNEGAASITLDFTRVLPTAVDRSQRNDYIFS